MKNLYSYTIKKNLTYTIIATIELIIVYILLNLSFSCILQSGGDNGVVNSDSLTIFGYIAVAAIALYIFTVAVQTVVNYSKTAMFYQISVSLGANIKMLIRLRFGYNSTVYGCAFTVGFIVATLLDLNQLKEDGIRFFTFAGQGITIAVYVCLFILNSLLDIYAVKKCNVLKELLGGTDNV